MRSRVNVKSRSKAAVTVKAFAFLVTSDFRTIGSWVARASQALELLLMVTARAFDCHFHLTGCGFVTGSLTMADTLA